MYFSLLSSRLKHTFYKSKMNLAFLSCLLRNTFYEILTPGLKVSSLGLMPWELPPDRVSLLLICDSRCELREAVWCLHVSIWGNKNSDCKNWVQHRSVKFNAILEKYRLYRTHFFTVVWCFLQILFSYISSRYKYIHFDLGRHVVVLSRVGFKKKKLYWKTLLASLLLFLLK